jgi:hypothetical protein
MLPFNSRFYPITLFRSNMSLKDTVFELVQSLNQTEKRHFNLFSRRFKTKSPLQYYTLYKQIDSHKILSEDEFASKFPVEFQSNNYSSQKKRLLEKLLACLNEYYLSKEVGNRIHNMIWESKVFQLKGMNAAAESHLNKAKTHAIEHGFWGSALEINLLERRSIKKSRRQGMMQELEKKKEEKNTILLDLEEYYHYLDLWDIVSSKQRRGGNGSEEVHWESLKTELELAFPFLRTQQAIQITHQIFSYYWLRSNAIGKALSEYQIILQLWESKEAWREEFPLQFIIHINNYLSIAHLARNYSEFPKYLARIKQYESGIINKDPSVITNSRFLEMIFFTNNGDIKGALEKAKEANLDFEANKALLPISRINAFKYNYSVILFLEEEYREALDVINSMLNAGRSEHRIDLQEWGTIIQLLARFQMMKGEFDQSLFDLSVNMQRRVMRDQDYGTLVNKVSGWVSALLKVQENKRKPVFEKLINELEKLLCTSDEGLKMDINIALIWARSHFEGVTIREKFKEFIAFRQEIGMQVPPP